MKLPMTRGRGNNARALPAGSAGGSRDDAVHRAPSRHGNPVDVGIASDAPTRTDRARARAGRIPARMLSPVEQVTGSPRSLTLPPVDVLAGLREDLPALAAAWQAAYRSAASAVAAVDDAIAPAGRAWRAARAVDAAAVRAGTYTAEGSEVARVMRAGPDLTAAACAAVVAADAALDQVCDTVAGDADMLARTDAAVDAWVDDAVARLRDAAQRRDRVELARLDEGLSVDYRRIRNVWQWVLEPGIGWSDNARGVPVLLAAELVTAIEDHGLATLMGHRHRLYGDGAVLNFLDAKIARDMAGGPRR